MRSPGSGVERHAPFALVDRPHLGAGRRGGNRGTRAGSCPCRRSPARCSARAAGSLRSPVGRHCPSPSRAGPAPSPPCCPGCAPSRPGRNRSPRSGAAAYSRAAARIRSGATPLSFSTSSGLLRGSAMKAAQARNASRSQRSRTYASSTRPFGHDDMRHRVQHGDIGAGSDRQVIRSLDMRRAHQVDPPRVDRRSASPLHATASSCARRTPDARRSGWRRSP